jgi:hypothetical protein
MATPDDSFITLHRKITQWEWYTDTNTKCLFIHLLLLANHKQTKWRGETIERGQVLTGRKRLSEELNLSEKQIRVALDKLKTTDEIKIRANNHFSIITINNYSTYQDKKDNSASKKGPAKRPADGPAELIGKGFINNDLFGDEYKKGPAKGPADGQTKGQQGATSNNDNNDNNKRDSYESLPSNFQLSEYRDESIRFAEWWAKELRPGTIKDNMTNRVKWAHVWFHLRATDGRANGAEMCEAISWARSEPFWSTNFLSPTKLRDKDKNGVMYIDRFLEQYRKQKDGRTRDGQQQRGITADKLGRLADHINGSHNATVCT